MERIDQSKSAMTRTTPPSDARTNDGDLLAGRLMHGDESFNRDVQYGIANPQPDGADAASWLVDRELVRLLALVAGLLLLAILRWRTSFWRVAARRLPRPDLAGALLGAVWWICLSPSAIGLALLAAAAISAVRRQQHQPLQNAGQHDSFELAV